MGTDISNRLYAFDRRQGEGAGALLLAGVDEVGRGPLAGPVVAAAVIFHSKEPIPYLNDSKKLTPEIRIELFRQIMRTAFVGIGAVEEGLIDEINIYQATRLAMRKALLSLTRTPDFVLVDGTMQIDLPLVQKAVIKGDQLSASIAAASIMAKVHRDRVMEEIDRKYPQYGFARHKGYATEEHIRLIRRHGASPVHRKSFSPFRRRQEEFIL